MRNSVPLAPPWDAVDTPLARLRAILRRFPRRRGLLAALVLAGALVLMGVSLAFLTRAQATVTLSAAPAGHISPGGPVRVDIGSQLTVTAWSDDPDMKPWLMIGAEGVQPAPAQGNRYTYTFTVVGDTGVQASFLQLADNVRVFPPGFGPQIVSVSAALDEVVIVGTSEFVSGLAIGDILANTAGSGYDGRLTVGIRDIRRDGDRTILRTEPVPFTDAIVKASIRAAVPLRFATDGTGRPTSLIGPSVARAGDIVSGGLTLPLTQTFEQEGVYGQAKAVVNGNLTLDLALQFSLDIGGGSIFPPRLPAITLFELALAESASASASLDAETHGHMAQAATLLAKSFPAIQISILHIEPQIELGVGVDITADAGLKVKASAQEQLRVGIRFQDGNWSPIQEFHASTDGSIDVAASATARLYPSFRLGATLDWLCTPYVKFQPGFFELQADIHANPWWKLDAGMQGTAGIDCDLLVTKLQWQMDEQELTRMRVKDAGGPLVAAVTPSPVAATASPGIAIASPLPTQATVEPSTEPSGIGIEAFPAYGAAAAGFPAELGVQHWACAEDAEWCARVPAPGTQNFAPHPAYLASAYNTRTGLAGSARCSDVWMYITVETAEGPTVDYEQVTTADRYELSGADCLSNPAWPTWAVAPEDSGPPMPRDAASRILAAAASVGVPCDVTIETGSDSDVRLECSGSTSGGQPTDGQWWAQLDWVAGTPGQPAALMLGANAESLDGVLGALSVDRSGIAAVHAWQSVVDPSDAVASSVRWANGGFVPDFSGGDFATTLTFSR